jgi:hypothetical protein
VFFDDRPESADECRVFTHVSAMVRRAQGRLFKVDERRRSEGAYMFLRFFTALSFSLCAVFVIPSSSTAAPSPPVVAAATLTYFATEHAAQVHCPRDVVVWLNIPSGIYHYRGERWYGRTKHGAYVCEREAAAAGDRASANGQ